LRGPEAVEGLLERELVESVERADSGAGLSAAGYNGTPFPERTRRKQRIGSSGSSTRLLRFLVSARSAISCRKSGI
jgi:hypothetical protein